MRKTTVTDDEVAGLAYETYCKAVGGKSFNGDTLPTWAEMKKSADGGDAKKETIVVAWKRAARAVASLVEKKLPPALIPVAAESMDDPAKIAPYPVTGAPSGRVSSATPNLSSLPKSSPLPAPSRTLVKRTKCCGSFTLTLKTGHYVCPCGDHTESLT